MITVDMACMACHPCTVANGNTEALCTYDELCDHPFYPFSEFF